MRRTNFEKLHQILGQEDFSSVLEAVARIAFEPTSNKKLDKRGYSELELEQIGEEILLSLLQVKQIEGELNAANIA